jgi:hypothetical protein
VTVSISVCVIFPVYNIIWLKWNFAMEVTVYHRNCVLLGGIALDIITECFDLIIILFPNNG